MEDDKDAPCIKAPPKARQPERPCAIPPELESIVIDLYKDGYGYRAIARILRKDYRIDTHFNTVKRTLLRPAILPHPGSSVK